MVRDLQKAQEQSQNRVREIHVRSMKRKWGSISSRGRLTLNVDLLTQSAAFRREVIVHELVHLKVPNHGKLFKALLKAYLDSHELYPHSR
ncbi:MAG: M48 family metallopeptidase [Armatimonadota bacterium]